MTKQPTPPESELAAPEQAPPQPATPSLQPATCNLSPVPTASPPATNSNHRRNGDVARLPKAIRHRINQMLDDGLTYPQIVQQLAHDAPGLSTRSVMSWKGGGYQDYLQEQRLIQHCHARQGFVLELFSQNHSLTGFQATQQLAAAQICEAVAVLGPEILHDALKANPLNYFRMLNSFARLTTGGLKCERHLAEEAERKSRLENRVPDSEKGLSDRATREMEEKLNLL